MYHIGQRFGDGMVDQPGISAKFFTALAKANVNIRAIAQGSSERNISAVINEVDSTRALRAVHAGFYLSDQTLSIGIIGHGLIGKTFLSQLFPATGILKKRFKVDLRVRAIANSKKMLLSEAALDLNTWMERFDSAKETPDTETLDLERFVQHVPFLTIYLMLSLSIVPQAKKISEHYPQWLRQKNSHYHSKTKSEFWLSSALRSSSRS